MNIEFSKQYEEQMWKNKSLEVRENADWTCTKCNEYFGYDKWMLHAHHTYYWIGEYIWSDMYKDGDIIALCSDCHNEHHKNNKVILKQSPNSISSSYYNSEYYLNFLKQKQIEEREWMIVYQNMNDNEDYHTIESAKPWIKFSKGEKIKLGKYASKMCNYLGIDTPTIQKKMWKEKTYPISIFKYINKNLDRIL